MCPESEIKKKKVKKVKKTTSSTETEKVIQKPEASASEIDKVQQKRTLKPMQKKIKRRAAGTGTGRDIGVDISKPTRICHDDNCPFHGTLSVKGQFFDAVVVTNKMMRTTVVSREHRRYIPKYERYERRTSKISAHSPKCIDAQIGETVRVMECRPLSKNVSFVIIGRL